MTAAYMYETHRSSPSCATYEESFRLRDDLFLTYRAEDFGSPRIPVPGPRGHVSYLAVEKRRFKQLLKPLASGLRCSRLMWQIKCPTCF